MAGKCHIYITDPALWHLVKIEAAKQGITLQNATLEGLRLWLKKGSPERGRKGG